MRKINKVNTSTPFKRKVLTSVTAMAVLAGASFGLVSVVDVFATGLDGVTEEVESISLEGGMPVEGDLSLEGEGAEYRVKFMNYDGEELYNELLPSGTFIQEPEVPERIGFTFLGWAPEVDVTVTDQDVVYTAQFVETDGGYAGDDMAEDVVVYDNESSTGSDNMFSSSNGDFTNFLFMVILFLMETVWLHDRRSQQMRRYDAVMNMLDKE